MSAPLHNGGLLTLTSPDISGVHLPIFCINSWGGLIYLFQTSKFCLEFMNSFGVCRMKDSKQITLLMLMCTIPLKFVQDDLDCPI